MAEIRLLSTDFDGTLIDSPRQLTCVPALGDVLLRYVERGARWFINTGRSLDHLCEGLELLDAPCKPHGAVTNEREIFFLSESGEWLSHEPWNRECEERHRDLFARSTSFFKWLEGCVAENDDVTIVYGERHPEGLVTTTVAAMDAFLPLLIARMSEIPDFSYQQNIIYLRFCHAAYSKGTALGEIASHLSLSPDEILAAGDNYNDLPMLDGTYASHPCCPANAILPVKKLVLSAGGYMARGIAGEGLAEALAEKEKPAAHRSTPPVLRN